jgi:hypothetical protein
VLPSPISVHSSELYIDLPQLPVESCTEGSSSLNVHPMITRRKARTHLGLISSRSPSPLEPHNLSSALQSPHWLQAMREELTALHHQHTWDLVPRHDSMNIVGSRWVFKTKLKSDGSVERFKARLVAKGYSQLEGIDFTETFSPVIKPTTIRLVLSLAITHGWPIRQLDVKNAFLHGHLKEVVYMEQPLDFLILLFLLMFVAFARLFMDSNKHLVLGLIDLALFCYILVSLVVELIHFYLFFETHTALILLLVYVDDIIVTSNQSSLLINIISQLSTEFCMKDLGPLHFFLGTEVNHFSGGLFLSQQKYARDILSKASMSSCNPIGTPLAQKLKLHSKDDSSVNATYFRSLVGALQYLTLTRLDFTHAVNLVYQFMHQPGLSHLQAVKRILRYLQGTLHYGIRLLSRSSLNLYGFSDADWAGCPDTRRSTTGYSIYLGSNCISWTSKKQPTVSRSSAEVEYRAMASIAAELTWITHLLSDIGLTLHLPPTLFCDNISALHMTVNPVFHACTKHIELDVHFVRKKVAAGTLITRYVPSSLQVADILTKALSKDHFHSLRIKLGVLPPPPSSLRGSESKRTQFRYWFGLGRYYGYL